MMWRKGNSPVLLVGMQIDATTLGNCVVVPQKTKYRTTILCSNSTPGHISRKKLHWKRYKESFVLLYAQESYKRTYGHMVVLYFVFWGTTILFSIVVAWIYILTKSVEGYPFIHTFSSIWHFLTCSWWPFWQVWGGTS